MSWFSRSAGPRGRPALLEVSRLSKSFGPLTVLREVSLQVGPGEMDEPTACLGVAETGLGLPIARGIVEAHGGALGVAPADPGASFVVALPADPPPGSTGEPAGASRSVAEEPEEVRGG